MSMSLSRAKKRVVVVSLLTAIFLTLLAIVFALAAIAQQPELVTVTNITDSGATITWVTEEPTVGRVFVFPKGKGGLNVPIISLIGKDLFYDDRDMDQNQEGEYVLKDEGYQERKTHHVSIRGLLPETEYEFRIVGKFNTVREQSSSDNLVIENFKTGKINEELKTPDPAYGKVSFENPSNSNDAIVKLVITNNNEIISQTVSTYLSNNGTWSIDTNSIREIDLNSVLNIDADKHIEKFFVITGDGKSFSYDVNPELDQPTNEFILSTENKDISKLDNSLISKAAAACDGLTGEHCNSATDCLIYSCNGTTWTPTGGNCFERNDCVLNSNASLTQPASQPQEKQTQRTFNSSCSDGYFYFPNVGCIKEERCVNAGSGAACGSSYLAYNDGSTCWCEYKGDQATPQPSPTPTPSDNQQGQNNNDSHVPFDDGSGNDLHTGQPIDSFTPPASGNIPEQRQQNVGITDCYYNGTDRKEANKVYCENVEGTQYQVRYLPVIVNNGAKLRCDRNITNLTCSQCGDGFCNEQFENSQSCQQDCSLDKDLVEQKTCKWKGEDRAVGGTFCLRDSDGQGYWFKMKSDSEGNCIPVNQGEDKTKCNPDDVKGMIKNRFIFSSKAASPSVLAVNNRLEVSESGLYKLYADNNFEQPLTEFAVHLDGSDTVVIKLFVDSNGNGIKDAGEEEMTDVSQLQLRKESEVAQYNLAAGWNAISLPLVSNQGIDTASELITLLNNQGADIKHIAKYTDSGFQMYTRREGDVTYSNDFNLIPGQGYFILNYQPSVVEITGNKFNESVPFRVRNGWNLVGVYTNEQPYTAEEMINEMTAKGISSTTVSRYSSGIYSSVVYEDNVLFGNDFNLYERQAYFVIVTSGGGDDVRFTPMPGSDTSQDPAPNPDPTPEPTPDPEPDPTPTPTPTTGDGIWISQEEIDKLPMNGAAWDRLYSAADSNWGEADLSILDSNHDVNTLAGALVAARTGDQNMYNKTVAGLQSAMKSPLNRALELSRGLQSYVIAADIIGYRTPEFQAWVRDMLNKNIQPHTGGSELCNSQGVAKSCTNLGGILCTAYRSPNNWGGHARASAIAAALYLDDQSLLTELVKAHKAFIGENVTNSLYCQDTNWHPDTNERFGVNKTGTTIQGHNVSGVLPEDWRRGGEFAWPPGDTVYMWEGMQGYVVSAVLLHRAGLVSISAGDNAVVRSMDMLYSINNSPESNDTWIPWLVNQYTGKSYPTSAASSGRGMGWTDWTSQ